MEDSAWFGWWSGLLGSLILIAAFADAAVTAVRAEKGGSITRLFVDVTWRLLLSVRKRGNLSHGFLSFWGSGLLLVLILIWEPSVLS